MSKVNFYCSKIKTSLIWPKMIKKKKKIETK